MISLNKNNIYAEKTVADIDKVIFTPRFTHEYGFVNKRLPVWKVTYKGSEDAYYVETFSTKLAVKVTKIKRLDGLNFVYLQKAHFLDFLDKQQKFK